MTEYVKKDSVIIKTKAPAKVNWHLQVGRRRYDGFHSICSVFQTIDIFDRLSIECRESDSAGISVTGLEQYVESGNSTLDKAFKLWTEITGKKLYVAVNVEKQIPVQSGLGGGSSDAGTLILALEQITGNSLSHDCLVNLAASTGSDVPFFVSGCRAALVYGRGEFVKPIRARNDISGWVIVPRYSKKSTSQAYSQLDRRPDIPDFTDFPSLVTMYEFDTGKWNFTNDFELVNESFDFPVKSFLTGSGSCRIVLYSDVSSYLKCNDRAYCDSFVSDRIGELYSKISFAACNCTYPWA